MNELTNEMKQEISFLIREHAYSQAEATLTVLRPKTKFRAPTIEEIETLSASQIGAYSKC